MTLRDDIIRELEAAWLSLKTYDTEMVADHILAVLEQAGTIVPRQTVYETTTGQGPTYRSVEAHPQTMLCIPWEDTE